MKNLKYMQNAIDLKTKSLVKPSSRFDSNPNIPGAAINN